MKPYFHIIDPDCFRRAQLAREIVAHGFHAEIYESRKEFLSSAPSPGFVLAHHEELFGTSEDGLGHSAPLPFVVYAEQPSTEDVVSAMYAGAIDYLDWPTGAKQFDSMLRRVAQQGNEKARMLRRSAKAREMVATLSRRERQILVELLQGKSTKQMALALDISPRTAEIHRGNMMRKLRAGSPATAVQVALLAGLDDDVQQQAA